MSENANVGWTEALGGHADNPQTPRASGDIITDKEGVEWKLSTNEGRIKAQFEQWVRNNASKVADEMEREGNHEEARKYRNSYTSGRAAGHYNWDGSACRDALMDLPGVIHFLFLLLRRCQPKVTEQQALKLFKEVPEQVGQAVAWALGNLQAPEESRGLRVSER